MDSDAANFIAARESADGSAMRSHIKAAVDAFVVGAKSAGVWDALDTCYLFSGANTLAGSLVALRGPAPTNNGFVDGDYEATQGLKASGSQYLDTGRLGNHYPQNDCHLAVYVTESQTGTRAFAGAGTTANSSRNIVTQNNSLIFRANSGTDQILDAGDTLGLIGWSRSSSSQYDYWHGESNGTISRNSVTPLNSRMVVFARDLNGTVSQFSNARLSFFSFGTSINHSALRSLVNGYMLAIQGGNSAAAKRRLQAHRDMQRGGSWL